MVQADFSHSNLHIAADSSEFTKSLQAIKFLQSWDNSLELGLNGVFQLTNRLCYSTKTKVGQAFLNVKKKNLKCKHKYI